MFKHPTNTNPKTNVRPEFACDLTQEISPEKLAEFGDWFDQELKKLESEYPEFETRQAYRYSMGR